MNNTINIEEEVIKSYKALEGIKTLSKVSALSIKSLNEDDLKIDDFIEIFNIIIDKAEQVEESVSKLELLDNN